MTVTTRVWSAGRLLVLLVALVGVFAVFFWMGVRVALRAREVEVPSLVGRNVNEATQLLADRDLTLKIDDTRRPDARVPANRIAQQDPPAGSRVRSPRSVRVWVSQGQRTATVPELIGQTERTARIRLQQDGFEVGTISHIRAPEYPVDAVVAQDPPPDSKAARVSLLLNARGDDAVVMPDLVGAEGTGTASALRERGFRVTITEVAPSTGVTSGAIVAHTPMAGSRVSPADSITLEVSR